MRGRSGWLAGRGESPTRPARHGAIGHRGTEARRKPNNSLCLGVSVAHFSVSRSPCDDFRHGLQALNGDMELRAVLVDDEQLARDELDYLLEPVDPNRLEVAVQRARRRVSSDLPLRGLPHVDTEQLEKIIQLVTDRQSRRERLAIKVGERFLLVQADEIIYASMADESITVVTPQHSGTSNYRTLDELQARLDPSVFWRVHRSHLVNINKIKEIVPWFSRNYILRMKDAKATEIPVSRTQTRRLREYL